MSLYTKLLWLQKYFQDTDLNILPEINDIDFLILPSGEINIDIVEELSETLENKLKTLTYSSIDIDDFDLKRFNKLKPKIRITCDPANEGRLLIRGAFVNGKSRVAFFDLEFREIDYETISLTKIFRIQSKAELIEDKIKLLEKLKLSFGEKLLIFLQENKQDKIQTLLELSTKLGLDGTRTLEAINNLLDNDNITIDDLRLIEPFLNSMVVSNNPVLKEWSYYEEFIFTTDNPKHKKKSWDSQLKLLKDDYKPKERKMDDLEKDKIYGIIIIIHLLESLKDTKFKNYKFLIKGGFATNIHVQSPELFEDDEPQPEFGADKPQPEFDADEPQSKTSISLSESNLSSKSVSKPKNKKKKSSKKPSQVEAVATQVDDESWYVEPTYYDQKWKQIKEFWNKNKSYLIAAGVTSLTALYLYFYPTEENINPEQMVEMNDDGSFLYIGEKLPEGWLDVTGSKKRKKRTKRKSKKRTNKKRRSKRTYKKTKKR